MQPISTASCLEVLWQSVTGVVSGNRRQHGGSAYVSAYVQRTVLCVSGRTKRQAGRGARKDSELSVYCFNRGDSFCRCKDGGGSHRLIHDGGSRGLRHAVWNELPSDAYFGGGSGYSVYDYRLVRCVLPGIEAGRHDCASGSIGFDTSVCRKENSEMKIII